MRFERFIQESNLCATKAQLIECFEKILAKFGIDKFIYCVARDNVLNQAPPQHGVMRSYPEDWMTHYAARQYIKADPTYRQGLITHGPFSWKGLRSTVPLTKSERRVMDEADEAGLKSGITIAIHGPHGQVIGLGLAASHRNCEPSRNELHLLNGLANQFHMAYVNLSEQPPATPVKLSDRQREVLQWAAAGKSRSDMAHIMAVSEGTIDDHFRCIFRKLKCHDRLVAVLRAITLGLIQV